MKNASVESQFNVDFFYKKDQQEENITFEKEYYLKLAYEENREAQYNLGVIYYEDEEGNPQRSIICKKKILY